MRSGWLVNVVVSSVVGALVAGCDDAPSTPAHLELSTTLIDFGGVEIDGHGAAAAVALTNRGTEPYTIAGFRFESSSPELTMEAPPSAVIEGEALLTVRFGYAPTVSAVVTATLTIDGPDAPRVFVRGWGATLGYRIEHDASACAGVPGSVDLGTSDGTAPLRRTVRIVSTGTGPIRIGARLDPLGSPLVLSPAVLDRRLDAGASAELELSYDPALPEPLAAAVVIDTNAVHAPGVRIPTCAEARFPVVCVRPERLDLGLALPGSALVGRFDVVNCGNAPLPLTAIALATDAAHPATPGFTVSSTAPVTLAPGVGTPVHVRLVPPSDDGSSAFVQISAQAPDQSETFVAVAGNQRRPCALVVTPDPIELRAVIEAEREARVTNVGGEDCVIDRLELVRAGAAFSITRTPELPATITPGGALAFGVAYAGSTARVRAAVELHLTSGDTVAVPVSGDPTEPADCFAAVRAPVLDFGLLERGATALERVEVVNHGRRPCRIRRAELSPSTDARFRLDSGAFPVTVPAHSSVFLRVELETSANTVALGRLDIETDDPDHPLLAVSLLGGSFRCDDDCSCGPSETLTLWRFDDAWGASSINPANGDEAFHRSCDVERCAPGQVAVEVARRVFECVAPPPVCAPGEGLGYDERALDPALECVPCDVVIQYGGLYDNLRVCGGRPELSCLGGLVPTFDVDARDWLCAPACNNGAYDRLRLDSVLVCVPC